MSQPDNIQDSLAVGHYTEISRTFQWDPVECKCCCTKLTKIVEIGDWRQTPKPPHDYWRDPHKRVQLRLEIAHELPCKQTPCRCRCDSEEQLLTVVGKPEAYPWEGKDAYRDGDRERPWQIRAWNHIDSERFRSEYLRATACWW